MKLSQFKFKLPEEKIALHPTKYRDESRLMVLNSLCFTERQVRLSTRNSKMF